MKAPLIIKNMKIADRVSPLRLHFRNVHWALINFDVSAGWKTSLLKDIGDEFFIVSNELFKLLFMCPLQR